MGQKRTEDISLPNEGNKVDPRLDIVRKQSRFFAAEQRRTAPAPPDPDDEDEVRKMSTVRRLSTALPRTYRRIANAVGRAGGRSSSR
jgi:hypothetical protein